MPKNKRNRHRKARQWRNIDVSDAEAVAQQKTADAAKAKKNKRDDEIFFKDVSFASTGYY